MKFLNIILSFFIVCNSVSDLHANGNTDDSLCLQIVGIVLSNKVPVDGVNITLYKENEELEMIEITSVEYHDHSFSFKLLRNSFYTIKIAKEGFITRMVSISTKLPVNTRIKPLFYFEFEMEMPRVKEKINDYYVDFPIALIDYDINEQTFVLHEKYTTHIKNKIKQTVDK